MTAWYDPLDGLMWVRLFILMFATLATSQPATTPSADAFAPVEQLLAKGDRAGAIREFGRIPDSVLIDPALADRAVDVRARINQAGDELLDQAEALFKQKKYADATDRLAELLTATAGLPPTSLVRQRLAEMCSRQEIEDQFEIKKRQGDAEAALAEARRTRDAGKDEAAYGQFKAVVTNFPDTPAAKTAAETIKLFESDPRFLRRQKDDAVADKARPMLNLAQNYISAGRIPAAKKLYQKVIDEFPQTSFAETAKTELAKLK